MGDDEGEPDEVQQNNILEIVAQSDEPMYYTNHIIKENDKNRESHYYSNLF